MSFGADWALAFAIMLREATSFGASRPPVSTPQVRNRHLPDKTIFPQTSLAKGGSYLPSTELPLCCTISRRRPLV
eukprot:5717315-Karenia_brevis.AAC.1